ncbi:hypothetical protein KGY79_09660, partial [Candidatus Bipolaricaulota bacterium]|nr:hypothetical protein [Candidatus Bipolaricaulota bacterium]
VLRFSSQNNCKNSEASHGKSPMNKELHPLNYSINTRQIRDRKADRVLQEAFSKDKTCES